MKPGENRPAFPENYGDELLNGINVREYFAAKMMQAMIGSHDHSRNGPHETVVDHEKRLAHHAVRFADALIEELANTQ